MFDRPLRVLSIAHPAVKRDSGRLRYHPLAGRADIGLHLLVPRRWHQFGRVLTADLPDDGGIQVEAAPIRLPKAGPMSWYLHFYPGLRRLLRRLDPDVIHLWEEPWSVVALQACLLKGRAAVVLEVDQNIQKRLPAPFESLRRFVLRRTAHVLCRSPDAAAVVRAGGYDGPVSFIGYGVDRELFRPLAETGPARTLGSLRIGYVGRLVVEKGLDDALDAMARSAADVRLAIMGEGPDEPRLRGRVAELGLTDRVSFAPWGATSDVVRFIQSLDALILLTRTTPTVREQFGRVIIEAQSCGVPVIGSSCGAIPSVIGLGGWVVPENDPEALARLLDAIATRPDAIAEKRKEGLRNVQQRFTFEAVARDLASAWTSAACERRGETSSAAVAPTHRSRPSFESHDCGGPQPF